VTARIEPECEEKTPGSQSLRAFLFGSGGGIRTPDLRVMSPTSYLAALPRNNSVPIGEADSMGPQAFVNRETGLKGGVSLGECDSEHPRSVEAQPVLPDLLPAFFAGKNMLGARLDVAEASLEPIRSKNRSGARGAKGESCGFESGLVCVDGGGVGFCALLDAESAG
jgi:hypothetical protein